MLYTQRTWAPDGRALHAETGYLRSPPDGSVELVVAQPTGIVEIHTGTLSEETLDLHPISVQTTPSALPVRNVARRLHVIDNTLSYEVEVAINHEQLAPHLRGSLAKRPPEPVPTTRASW